MSRHAAVELDFADGTYTFRLGLREIDELEEKCDCGIYQIFLQCSEARTFRLKMISETLRIGLIGGGIDPAKALSLVRRYVDERPVEENRDVAFAVLAAGLARVNGEDLKKQAEGETDDAGKPEAEGSTSQPSTEAQA